MRKPFHTPVVEISEGPSPDKAKRTFTVGSIAFPGLSNPAGHVLDRLKRQQRAK